MPLSVALSCFSQHLRGPLVTHLSLFKGKKQKFGRKQSQSGLKTPESRMHLLPPRSTGKPPSSHPSSPRTFYGAPTLTHGPAAMAKPTGSEGPGRGRRGEPPVAHRGQGLGPHRIRGQPHSSLWTARCWVPWWNAPHILAACGSPQPPPHPRGPSSTSACPRKPGF